jgi:hypothetical protein
MVMGVGQGDVLSPLLFNLFIESLSRYIACQPGFDGINVHGVVVKELKYADDICNPASTPAQLQTALDATKRWSDAWGIELGLGELKTQALALRPPGQRDDTVPLAPLPVLGTALCVDWTDEYKYLGYWIRRDLADRLPKDDAVLCGDEAIAAGAVPLTERERKAPKQVVKMVHALHKNWNRYFVSNALVRNASPAFALQIYRTVVLGASNFLLSITEPTPGVVAIIDSFNLRVTRKVIHVQKRVCNPAVRAEGGIMPAIAILARERTRLALKLRDTPFADSIAHRLYTAIMQERHAAKARPLKDATYSWFWRTADHEAASAAKGFVRPEPSSFSDIPRVAGVYGRELGLAAWSAEAQALKALRAGMPNCTVGVRPPSVPAAFHAAWINLGYDYRPGDAGACKSTTPLSCRGPGACASIIPLVLKRFPLDNHFAIANLRNGRVALHTTPLAPVGGSHAAAVVAAVDADRAAGRSAAAAAKRARQSSAVAEWSRRANKDGPCRLCRGDHEDPYHVLLECTDPATVAQRALMVDSLNNFLVSLCRHALIAMSPHAADGITPDDGHAAINVAALLVAVAAMTMDWTSAEGRWVAYRLLACASWPARAAQATHPFGLATALGMLLDAVQAKPHHLRPLANAWFAWASGWVLKITRTWARTRRAPDADAVAATEADDDAEELPDADVENDEDDGALSDGEGPET